MIANYLEVVNISQMMEIHSISIFELKIPDEANYNIPIKYHGEASSTKNKMKIMIIIILYFIPLMLMQIQVLCSKIT